MKSFASVDRKFKNHAFGILFVFLLFLSTGSQAEQVVDTSGDIFKNLSGGQAFNVGIQDSILKALENNPTVTIQRIQSQITSASVEEQRAAFDPELSVVANKSKTKTEAQLGTRPEPLQLTTERSRISVAISETLPTGTTLSLSSDMSGSVSSLYTDQASGSLQLSVTQSLLRGFGTGPNLASLRKAKIDVDISQAELKTVAENLVAGVERAYWDLYLAGENISIQKESLALAEQQLNESIERVAVGKLAEIELAAVNAEAASRRELLINAQAGYEKARLQFLYLLNPQGENIWEMMPATIDKPFVPKDAMDEVSVHEQLGLKYRADLQQARLSMEKGELEVQQTKNGLLPRLDFFINYGKSSYAESFSDATPDPGSPYSNLSSGLTLTIPFSNRSAKAKHAKSLQSMEKMELSLKNMERLVELDIRSAYIEAVKSRHMIEATKVARELHQKNMDAELEKFRVGKSTNILVLQAQRDFTAAKVDESEAMVGYLKALINLYQMQGTLLERRGIEGIPDSL
ncbi:MAG: TolC family protein [Deltaproteobacteria bacterium]|nr:TolC family protein [Deltaproteobacteria bacterium]